MIFLTFGTSLHKQKHPKGYVHLFSKMKFLTSQIVLRGLKKWQIHHSVIGERPQKWCTKKLHMSRPVIRMVNLPFLKPANEEGLNQHILKFIKIANWA